jgi:hypothetical protein
MKSTITLYRIFSYILIIIGVFIGIGVLISLLVALANPALLLNVFVGAAVVMYSFSSFLFLTNGINRNKQLKPGMKDFIRVNAFVAIVFGIMNIFQAITVITNPSVLNEAIKQLPQMPNAQHLPTGMILKVMKAVIWFLLFYAIILLIHIQITFRLLKQYAHLFGAKADDGNNSF